jgi:hypothetical protein
MDQDAESHKTGEVIINFIKSMLRTLERRGEWERTGSGGCAKTASAAPGSGMAEELRGRRRGRRSGADGEAAQWSGRRGGTVERTARQRGPEARRVGGGRRRVAGERDGGASSGPERWGAVALRKVADRVAGPMEVGFQTTTNFAMGRNCRGGFRHVENSRIWGSQMSP